MLHEAYPIYIVFGLWVALVLWHWLAPDTWASRREFRERRRRGFEVVIRRKAKE